MTAKLSNQNTDYSVSFVIEWDNARLCETSRSVMMLRQLHDQLASILDPTATNLFFKLRTPVELVFVFDPLEVDDQSMKDFVYSIFEGSEQRFDIRFYGAPGMVYFEMKNYGFQQTSGDLLVFLDSDVIPEEGWLLNILNSFENPEVEVVAGNPYVEVDGPYSKAFALAWFFPLRQQEKVLKPFHKFWANNVAFRRNTFSRFLFPRLDGYYRGSCMQLVKTLQENGITIYLHTGAQVSHPPPNGLGYFLAKGIAQGRNELLSRQVLEDRKYSVSEALSHFKHMFSDKLRLIRRNRSRLNLSIAGTLFAVSVATLYYSLYLTGEMITLVSPTFMAKRLKV